MKELALKVVNLNVTSLKVTLVVSGCASEARPESDPVSQDAFRPFTSSINTVHIRSNHSVWTLMSGLKRFWLLWFCPEVCCLDSCPCTELSSYTVEFCVNYYISKRLYRLSHLHSPSSKVMKIRHFTVKAGLRK